MSQRFLVLFPDKYCTTGMFYSYIRSWCTLWSHIMEALGTRNQSRLNSQRLNTIQEAKT